MLWNWPEKRIQNCLQIQGKQIEGAAAWKFSTETKLRIGWKIKVNERVRQEKTQTYRTCLVV